MVSKLILGLSQHKLNPEDEARIEILRYPQIHVPKKRVLSGQTLTCLTMPRDV